MTGVWVTSGVTCSVGVRYRGQERRRAERRVTGERRLVLVKHVATDVQKVHERLARAIKESDWRTTLHLASVQLQHPAGGAL